MHVYMCVCVCVFGCGMRACGGCEATGALVQGVARNALGYGASTGTALLYCWRPRLLLDAHRYEGLARTT